MSERLVWVDSVKGIAIIMVILGHITLPEYLHALIYSVHMPLFFLLSGLFLFHKERPWKDDFKIKVRTLIIPYLAFSVINLVFFDILVPLVFYNSFHIEDFWSSVTSLFIGERTRLWFLPCLFLSELLLISIPVVRQRKVTCCVVFAVCGCLLNALMEKGTVPLMLDRILISTSLVLMGTLIIQRPMNFTPAKILSLGAIYALLVNLSMRSVGNMGVDMFSDHYGNYLYFYTVALTGILLIIYISKRFLCFRVLSFIGKNTLLIYCMHFIFIFMVQLLFTYIHIDHLNVLLVALIELTLVCLLCVPTIYVVNRYIPSLVGKKR